MAKEGLSKDDTKRKLKSLLGSLISLGIIYWTFTYREFFGISMTITFALMFAFLIFAGALEKRPFLPVYIIVASLAFRAGIEYFSLLEGSSSLADLGISAAIVALMLIVSFRAYSLKEKHEDKSSRGQKTKDNGVNKKKSSKNGKKTKKRTSKKKI